MDNTVCVENASARLVSNDGDVTYALVGQDGHGFVYLELSVWKDGALFAKHVLRDHQVLALKDLFALVVDVREAWDKEK